MTLLASQTPRTFGNEARSIMKRIIFTLREKVLRKDKRERNILHTIKRRKANLIPYNFRTNSLPKHVIEGKIHLKVKVKCSRYRPGVAQRVGRGIALLFHDRGTRRG